MKLIDKVRAIRTALVERQSERKRLRGPAQLRYAIADALAMLDADAWRALTADAGFFMSHDYLTGLEPVLPANLAPRYALIFDGDQQPVAAVYMQLAQISLAQTRPVKPAVSAARTPLDTLKIGAAHAHLRQPALLRPAWRGIRTRR
jgi:hypothetical protein